MVMLAAMSDPSRLLEALPAELRAWRDRGAFVRAGAGNHQIFAVALGDRAAAPNETLLVLHGFPESSYSYHHTIEALSKQFRYLVLFDFLGFGLSDKPTQASYSLFEQADLALEVWRQLGVRGGHLLAHDMGDSVATELLARRERKLLPAWFDGDFASLTLTNGNMVMEMAKLRLSQRLLRLPWVGGVIGPRARYPLFAQQVASASGAALSQRDIELMWAAFRHNDGQQVQHRIIRYLDERDRFQNGRWLPALAVTGLPIHLLWGARDRVAPIRVADYLIERVCLNARLTRLVDGGHFCQQEVPEAWIKAALAFWTHNG